MAGDVLSSEQGEPQGKALYVYVSIGFAATAAGAFIALCVLATKMLTGGEVFGEASFLRLSALLMQTGAMLVGIGLLASVVRGTLPRGRANGSEHTNIRASRRL